MSTSKVTNAIATTPGKLAEILDLCKASGIVPCILGPVGVGKSSIASALAKKWDYDFIDTRLCYKSPTDVQGFGFVSDEKRMCYAIPEEYPDADSGAKGHVWLLDEFTCTNKWTQNASLQLVLDKRVGSYKVPENVFLILAGNGSKHGAHVQALSAAVVNRICIITLEGSSDDWLAWAYGEDSLSKAASALVQKKLEDGEPVKLEDLPSGDARIHPTLLAYITIYPARLLPDLDMQTWDRESGFATPRTWHMVSDVLTALDKAEEAGSPYSTHATEVIIEGLIGKAEAFTFNTFRTISSKLPSPKKVLEAKDMSVYMQKERENQLALLTSLIDSLTTKEYATRFLKEWLPMHTAEMRVYAVRTLNRHRTNSKVVSSVPAWTEFFLANADILAPKN